MDARTRLLQAQRDAVSQLQQAARPDASADQVQHALQTASRSLNTLVAATTILDSSLRNDLRRTASELSLLPSADTQRVASATRSAIALLEKVRAQLEADVALGLSFQGSFSQTKPKEAASGGHASAMGPAPPNVTVPDNGAAVPGTFAVGAQLPWTMYCGGPTKDHILESPCGGVALFDYDVRIVEGRGLETDMLKPRSAPAISSSAPAPSSPPRTTWMYEPFPAPDSSWVNGKPAIVLLWSPKVSAAQAALETLQRGAQTLTRAGVGSKAIALDASPDPVSRNDAILNRHLFMNRQDLRLPTGLLLDSDANVVKVYRGRVDIDEIVADARAIDVAPAERLARAVPFPGTFYFGLPRRNYLPYGSELLDNGIEGVAVTAFTRAAAANPGASTLYRLGTLLARTGETAKARAAFEEALALQPDLAEANNDLGTLLARGGDLDGAIGRFRAALGSIPEYPDALNNLGYALLLTGRDDEARTLYERALALQPDCPEALNNLGLLFGRAGDMQRAERYFRDALARRADYGEAANNLALVLASRGQTDAAVTLLQQLIERTPAYEAAYVTLAKIFLTTDRPKDAVAVLERLLQRNPTHAVALELLRQAK